MKGEGAEDSAGHQRPCVPGQGSAQIFRQGLTHVHTLERITFIQGQRILARREAFRCVVTGVLVQTTTLRPHTSSHTYHTLLPCFPLRLCLPRGHRGQQRARLHQRPQQDDRLDEREQAVQQQERGQQQQQQQQRGGCGALSGPVLLRSAVHRSFAIAVFVGGGGACWCNLR